MKLSSFHVEFGFWAVLGWDYGQLPLAWPPVLQRGLVPSLPHSLDYLKMYNEFLPGEAE